MRKTGLIVLAFLAGTVPLLLSGDDSDADTERGPAARAQAGHGGAGTAAFRSTNWSNAAPAQRARAPRGEAYSPLDELEHKRREERDATLAKRRSSAAARLEGVEIVLPMPEKKERR